MIDEGPSQEDLDRFGGDEALCPECGEPMWDQASVCPSCGAAVEGDTSCNPRRRVLNRRWAVLVALATAAGLVLLALRGII